MRIHSILISALIIASWSGTDAVAQVFPQTGAWLNTSVVAQNGEIRSRNDVIQEVKRRYNAKVLRIELSRDQTVYRVRILMPDGKVRNLSINARR
ncbi:hypothetical protein GCM10008090_26530 [Arenicella chitinivorans]|uniref:PepSY domain-containing protein n=1 Tax=Arenicella chitinivorans TaxID=1329800 RepID=A0A918RXX8_9GAMM|nr:hypothetical protein [Arenicella chitinivorans]GHA15654.1 hypothetical protein GCM10008090_26530 [Arenicella chitinivorans]